MPCFVLPDDTTLKGGGGCVRFLLSGKASRMKQIHSVDNPTRFFLTHPLHPSLHQEKVLHVDM